MVKLRRIKKLISGGIAFVFIILGAACHKRQAAGPAQMPAPQVVVAPAQTQTISETLSVIANVQANEMVEIKSETDGLVEDINFEEGKAVKKGQLLVRLDESKFAAAVAQADAAFKLSLSNYERAQQLFKDTLISKQEFDQIASVYQVNIANLELSKRQLKDARIYAPFNGVTGARSISPGQVISKNSILTWLIDLDPVKVEFEVPERYLGQVKAGQNIAITVASFPGKEFNGSVYFISPFINATNRTALIKAKISNENTELKPGMFGNLNLTLTVHENAIVIPEIALSQLLEGEQALIFVVGSDNLAAMRTVKLGVRLPGKIEVLEGLKQGENVIVQGLQKVVPGKPVRSVVNQDKPADPSKPASTEQTSKPSNSAKPS